MALVVRDLVAKYLPGSVTIKWPNDIYFNDRKAGGILIENTYQGTNWTWAIVGIGININQTAFPKDLPNPVSVKKSPTRTMMYCLLPGNYIKTC